MPAFTSYLLSMAIVFIIWGAIWYNLDRVYGVGLRRWWYNLTHEEPLAAGDERGFIYRRRTKTKFMWATVLSTVQSVLVVIYAGSIDLLTELPAWFIEVPLMMLGMYLGRPLGRLWGHKDQVFDKLDEWEHRGSARPAEKTPEVIDVEPEPPAGKPEAVEQPTPPDEPELDPEELIDRYTRRHGS